MHEGDSLAQRFEEERPRLTAVASRMLGSRSEAEDAVQETWLRFSRADVDGVENLGGWLTTVVSRVCLNVLQARRVRHEVPVDPTLPEVVPGPVGGPDPEAEALLADSVGLALLVVLDALSPSERVAFVLHDMFGVPFGEIARIVACSEPAARQLASRARRRVRGRDPAMPSDRLRQSRLVDAFLAAARGGDFAGLLAVLDPDVVLRADATAVKLGAAPETRGSEPVARFLRIARGATPVLIAGQAGAAWLVAGRPRVLFRFTVGGNAIVGVDLVADAEDIRMLNPVVVDVR